jgi:hypothetical protein
MVHPVFIDQLVRERHADLLSCARRARGQRARGQRARASSRDNVRERLGWLLVEWGLHLATRTAP